MLATIIFSFSKGFFPLKSWYCVKWIEELDHRCIGEQIRVVYVTTFLVICETGINPLAHSAVFLRH